MYLITNDIGYNLKKAFFKNIKGVKVIHSLDDAGKTIPFKELTKDIPRDFKHDVIIFNYGKIIKEDEASPFYLYNLHPSPLPFYKGPDPIGAQLLDGIQETVLTLQELSFDEIDGGTILTCVPLYLIGDIRRNLTKAIVKILTDYFNTHCNDTYTNKCNKDLLNLEQVSPYNLTQVINYLNWHKKNPYLTLHDRYGKKTKIRVKIGDVVTILCLSEADTLSNYNGVLLYKDMLYLKVAIKLVWIKSVQFQGKKWLNEEDSINGLKGLGLLKELNR